MTQDIASGSVARREAYSPVRRISEIMQDRLFGESGVDYRAPHGDPGLFGPDSVSWRVHSNPVSLAVGGVAAVILELAEPRVRTGVWEHSRFRTDPLRRIRRTGQAAMVTTYAPRAAAEARIAQVNRMHERVEGTTPEGQPYRAMDPELLAWVQLTASYGFLNAYLRFVTPLPVRDQDRYYAEAAQVGVRFGARDLPVTVVQAEERIQEMRPQLASHPIIGEFLELVSAASPAGLPGRVVQPFVVQAAIDLLPAWARGELRLPDRPARGAIADPMLRAMARSARLVPDSIAMRAYARMGRTMP